MNLVTEGIEILKEREILYVERFIPYFIASFGCHAFNLMNQDRKIYKTHGRVPDTRLQILFTAPPGFSKSLYLKQLLKEGYGLFHLPKSGIPTRFAGSVTEAGWTGSSDQKSGGIAMGLADRYKNGIVGMEEFKALSAIMEQKHSGHLEQALAMSLFEGDVEKDLKATTISYHTDITVWAGNQIMNFDLTGGLFRRFFQVYWAPSLWETRELEEAVWEGDNVGLNRPRLMSYRAEVMTMIGNLDNVKSIRFDDSVKDALWGVPHFEKSLYKCLALGWTIMSDSDVPSDLVVCADDPMIDRFEYAMNWRRQLLADPSGFQVEGLIRDLGGDAEPVKWGKIRELNLRFSVGFGETDEIIRRLMRQGRVTYDRNEKTVKLTGW